MQILKKIVTHLKIREEISFISKLEHFKYIFLKKIFLILFWRAIYSGLQLYTCVQI